MVDSRLDYRLIAQPVTGDSAEFVRVMFPVKTTAELADATDRINTVDKFLGKMAWDLTLDEPRWSIGPLAADAWETASEILARHLFKAEQVLGPILTAEATTAELADVGDAINTDNKRAGKIVWNTTTTTLVYAVTAAAGGVWNGVHDRALDHTPV